MQTKITGETLPVLEIGLEAGDKIVAEPGEFSWMTQTVQMNTTPMAACKMRLLNSKSTKKSTSVPLG